MCLIFMLALSACNLQMNTPNRAIPLNLQNGTATAIATETLPPYTPLASLTPSPTLRPPPTFEPPTATLPPTQPPTVTVAATLAVDVSIPGLHGAETPTPSTTPGCTPREDWKLTYQVQRDDALARIADRYNTSVQELVEANCLTDPNVIVIGQQLRVPGAEHPAQPAVECVPWEVLTPVDGSMAVSGEGQLTFNWRGPRAPRNLIRVIKPDGAIYERVVELRQNEAIDLADLPLAGQYTWYVFPLDWNFVQVSCKEGGPWRFSKEPKPPTATPLSLGP
jgi:LysM repeat protein